MVQSYTNSSESPKEIPKYPSVSVCQRARLYILPSPFGEGSGGEAFLLLIDAHLGHGAEERILVGIGRAEVGEVGARLVALVLAVVAAVGVEGTRGERTADAERRHVADGGHAPVADARIVVKGISDFVVWERHFLCARDGR